MVFRPCASGNKWKCLLSCRVLPFGLCDKLPNWAGVGRMKQAASEKGFLKHGHVIMLSLIGYKPNK